MQISRWGSYSLMLAGPLFLGANVVVGLAWHHPPFSWATNNISDLGNVRCGRWDTTRPRLVCSPWHAAMNLSLIVVGLLLVLGVLLVGLGWDRVPAARAAQVLLMVGAFGYALAGLNPADVNENNHFLAALLIFVLGNLGLVVAGVARRPAVLASMRWTSVVLAVIAVVGTGLFFARAGLGMGVGGMERVAVFPLLAWAFLLGLKNLRMGPSGTATAARRS